MKMQMQSASAFEREISDLAAMLAALAYERACSVREDEEAALRAAFDDTSVAGKLKH